MLDALPTHVLDTTRHRRPPAVSAISTHSATAPKPGVTGRTMAPPSHVDTRGKSRSQWLPWSHFLILCIHLGLAQFSNSGKLKPFPARHNTTVKALNKTPSKASGTPSYQPHVNNNSAPLTAFHTVSSPASSSNTSTSKTLIDSPLRGAGIGIFMAPSPEAYAIGHWTETVLEFVKCREAVIPVIESHLPCFSHDEDDIEFQAVLSEVFTVELSHLVVSLLKLDAFLKTVGDKV